MYLPVLRRYLMGKRIVEIRDMKTLKRSFPSRRNYLLTALFIGIALLSVAYLYFSDSGDGEFYHASIEKVEGAVTVLGIDSDEAVNAEEGMVLQEGDRIITGSESAANVSFKDGSYIRLSSGSILSVKSLFGIDEGAGVVVLNLSEGKLWSNVVDLEESYSRFEINTPSAVVGIRGTLFSLEVDNNKDAVAKVYKGLVGIFAATEEEGMVFSPQEGELVLDDMRQVELSYVSPLPDETEDIDLLAVDDFEKDCLVDDNPVLYVDVDLQATDLLTLVTEKRLNDILGELDVLYNEQDFITGRLARVLDDENRENLVEDRESLITVKTLLEREAEDNLRLFELIEEEYEFLFEQKESLDKIASRIDEGSEASDEEDFINEVRIAALDVRSAARTPQRIGREREINEIDGSIKFLRSEIVSNLQQLGLAEELEDLRKTVFLSMRQYSYPEQTASEIAGSYEETVVKKVARTVTHSPSPAPPPEPEIDDDAEEPADEELEFEVRLEKKPDDGGLVSGGGVYSQGSVVEISAVPAESYSFVGWESDGDIVNTDAVYNLTVNNDVSLKAVFELKEYLVLFVDHTSSKLHLEVVKHGYDATPPYEPQREGYTFTGWDNDFTAVTEDLVVMAQFERNEYTLNYIAGDNGAIEGEVEQKVFYGEDGSMVEAVPDDFYHFVSWSDGLKTATRTDLNVTDNLSVKADFAINTYEVVFYDHDGSVLEKVDVEHGEAAVPPEDPSLEGFDFQGWDKDYTYVEDNLEVTAIYSIREYTVTYEADMNGSVEGDLIQQIKHGFDGTSVKAVPDEGFYFAGWSDDYASPERYEVEVDKDIDLIAYFEPVDIEGDEEESEENTDDEADNEAEGEEDVIENENDDTSHEDAFIGPVKVEEETEAGASDEGLISGDAVNDKESKDLPEGDEKDDDDNDINTGEDLDVDDTSGGNSEPVDVDEKELTEVALTKDGSESESPGKEAILAGGSGSQVDSVNEGVNQNTDEAEVGSSDLQEPDIQEDAPLQPAEEDDESSKGFADELTDDSEADIVYNL